MPRDLLNSRAVAITSPKILFWSIYFLNFIEVSNRDIWFYTQIERD